MPRPNILGGKQDKLSASDIATFRQIELVAKRVVEGFLTGQHKSPFKGFAIEFEEHRQYVQGDDLKHLDWKLVGKTERYYIKQYEEDTSLRCFILLDVSGSMGYTSTEHSKYDLGRFIAGVFAYMLVGQADAVGLCTFDSKVRTFLPARSTQAHLKNMLDTLNDTATEQDTGLGSVMHQLANRIKRRAMVVIISDFFDEPEDIVLALNHFAHKKHEIVVFHVLDRKEEDFPFRDMTRFESLEGEEIVLTEPMRLKKEYQKQFQAHKRQLREACHRIRADFVPMYTDEPIETALARYLTRRLKR